jgi:hypothetical protein
MLPTSCRFLHHVQPAKTSRGAARLATERPNSESDCRASIHRSERIGGARLPYISPFMTFAEAIHWISKQEKCRRSEATRQIRAALADKAITGLCWEDQRSGMTAVRDFRPDYPPTDREFWQGEASIPDEKGRIFDRWTERWRTLLIPKDIIFQLWPKSGPRTKAKGGRPSARNEIDQAYHRLLELGRDMKKMAPMELATLIAKECGKKLGERGWTARTVLQHIQRLRPKH